jgi:hypothetical protein
LLASFEGNIFLNSIYNICHLNSDEILFFMSNNSLTLQEAKGTGLDTKIFHNNGPSVTERQVECILNTMKKRKETFSNNTSSESESSSLEDNIKEDYLAVKEELSKLNRKVPNEEVLKVEVDSNTTATEDNTREKSVSKILGYVLLATVVALVGKSIYGNSTATKA